MKKQALYFTAPSRVEVVEEPLPDPGPGQLLVRTLLSAISAGTELLIYSGMAPAGMATDDTIPSLAGIIGFPMRYGYAAVGEVAATGQGVADTWQGRRVFAFHPHENFFVADVGEVLLLPPDTAPEAAVFFPNVETAVTLVADGCPSIGEQVAVFGQGIVGLLVTCLLARQSLSSLVTLDTWPLRRAASTRAGADRSLDPNVSGAVGEALAALQGTRIYRGADLTYEISGNPEALDQAIAVTGYSGRVVIGSWYGRKRTTVQLGGPFHRSRMRLISSQVSSIEPERRGRWTKERLQQLTWQMVKRLEPSRFITHRFSLSEAALAYRLLEHDAGEALQVVLTY